MQEYGISTHILAYFMHWDKKVRLLKIDSNFDKGIKFNYDHLTLMVKRKNTLDSNFEGKKFYQITIQVFGQAK